MWNVGAQQGKDLKEDHKEKVKNITPKKKVKK